MDPDCIIVEASAHSIVAENGRAPGADIVDVLAVIGIKKISPLGAGKKYRCAADAAKSAHG